MKDPIVEKLNRRIKEREVMLHRLTFAAGAIIGFTIGLIVASILHKYIVHPLGW